MSEIQELTSKKKTVVSITILLCLGEILLFNSLARTVGAYISADLGNVGLYTLMNTIFFLCSTLAMPISCKLGNIFGRRNLIMTGIIIYSLSMLMAGMSNTMMMHVIFRGGQGLGQGFMLANCLTALGEIHTGPAKARYLGMYGTVAGICNIFGPTIGGFIYEALGWRWCFYGTVVVGAILVVLLITQYPNQRLESKTYIDIPGTLLLVLAASCAVFLFSWGGQAYAWNSPVIVFLILGAVVGTVAFILIERKSPEPIIPFRLFQNKNFTLCVLAACAIWPCMFASNAYFILYAQAIRGMAATASGAILSVQAMVNATAGIIVGSLIAWRGGRIRECMVVIVGMYAVSMFLQSTCNAATPVFMLYVMMCIIGFGNGSVMGAFTTGIQNNLPVEDISGGTATLQCLQSLTGTIGLSVMGLILNTGFNRRLTSVVPQGLTDLLSPDEIAPYLSATALVNRAGTEEFAAGLGAEAQPLFQTMMDNVNAAYAASLRTVFIVLLCLLVVALVSMLLLKENRQKVAS